MYCVEGTIGAGKSTFMQLIADHLAHTSVALEPMYAWQKDPHGQALLERFYANPQRWAYTIEMFALSHRVKEHMLEQARQQPFRIIERSIYTSHFVFARNGYDNGYMNDDEWTLCNDWFHSIVPGRCHPPNGFIYLRLHPEVAFERVKKRGWDSERHLTLDYLKQLHERYECFFNKKRELFKDLDHVPVLTLEYNDTPTSSHAAFRKHMGRLQDFFTKTQQFTPARSVQTLERMK